ncbi:peptidase S8 [Tissierella creatinini]|nr:peptidase S8 [Tissierella creatinini]TJX60561.1 peptidase S8 [Soehngenia saccharolytica]
MRKMIIDKLCPILNAKILAQSIEEVPVIIQFKKNSESLLNNITKLSSSVKTDLPLINGLAGNVSTEIIYRLSTTPEIDYISFDSSVYSLLDVALPSMNADFPHKKGYEGKGIGVAVIDTGVASHDDLIKPQNRVVAFKDFVNGKTEAYDDNGHGTHVAGIIAGNGYSSNGKYKGLAPSATIVAIKCLDKNGGGSVSDIISALSYVIEIKDKYNIKIINLSLGTPSNISPDKDPLVRAVENCVDAGLVVVTAAGNSGPGIKTILSPGVSKKVITVGAVDDKRTIDINDDTIASFSSRGPTAEGIQKPDLVAPGVNINSLSNTELNGYSSLSGTSMATPLVSGSLALLFNRYGDLSPQEYKEKLTDACLMLKDPKESQGAGMLDLKELFDIEEEEREVKQPVSDVNSRGDLFETVIVFLIIIFLLDSRI